MKIHDQKNGRPNSLIEKSMRAFLEALKHQTLPQTYCGVRLEVSFKEVDTYALLKRLVDRNIISPRVLAEHLLGGLDIEAEARRLKITGSQTLALHAAAVELLTPEERASMELHLRAPKGKGVLPVDHPEIAPLLQAIGVEKRKVTTEIIQRWIELDRPWLFLPGGPLRAVDHRAKLGPARSQGARGTCTAFAATAVAEGLEFLRDRRAGPRDFSEEFLWWYSMSGQLNSPGGGYDHRVSLDHYAKNGVPDEALLPYSNFNTSFKNVQVPVPDDAIDRAFDYRQPPFVTLPDGDISSVKAALESGRCVAFDCNPFNWNTATGNVSFPDPPLDSRGVEGGHATAIIGYIDRDDLPEECEGGYFIVRNSWNPDLENHLMGREYGGHLLMPYGWYRRYTGAPATFGSHDDSTGTAGIRQWQAEFFSNNKSLRGIPAPPEPVLDVALNRRTGEEFSARFTQIRRLRPGWYRFTLRGNDGMRLWVDDRVVINKWQEQSITSQSVEHYVTGGDHVLRVEYFTTRGSANVQLQIEEIEFQFDLFANAELAGRPAATFTDTMTDMEWRHAPPVVSPSDYGHFSLRATGSKHFAAGTYRFHAQHTGGCRMWVDDSLVLDDWSGLNGNGEPVTLSHGLHDVRVEFAHRTVPEPEAKSYYRASLAFDWSEIAWTGQIYNDDERRVSGDHLAVDGIHELFRVLSMTGEPVLTHLYSVPPAPAANYRASDDGLFQLHFPHLASFVQGIPGLEGAEARRAVSSVICTRRVYIPTDARYEISVNSEEVFRVCIDGNKVLDRIFFGSDPIIHEMMLHKGVHDVTIECADGAFPPGFDFTLKPANWRVEYYSGIGLGAEPPTPLDVPGAEFIAVNRPDIVPRSSWSVRATRKYLLGVGRYRVIVRADNGVRVRTTDGLIIDSWHDQPGTIHTAVLEHSGGPVDFVIEYYHKDVNSAGEPIAQQLSFEVKPDGFIGEYYRGVQLQVPAEPDGGNARNPPHAYRFEPTIDFDWGGTGRLARVGSDLFSARWWGLVELPVGRWKFKVTSDDGMRLFLDSRLLIDSWVDQAATLHEAIVDLAAGRRALRLEYYERTESAICRLELERLFGPGESILI